MCSGQDLNLHVLTDQASEACVYTNSTTRAQINYKKYGELILFIACLPKQNPDKKQSKNH